MRFLRSKALGNKYGNTRALCTLGHSHASKLESSVCGLIQLRERAGEIKLVQSQVHVYLTDARICYIPDFKCVDLATGLDLYIEAKGYASERWPIIKKLWAFYGPAPLEIWGGAYQSPKLVEVINPR